MGRKTRHSREIPPTTRSRSKFLAAHRETCEILRRSARRSEEMGRPKGSKNHPKPSGWTPAPKRANTAAAQLLARCMNGGQAVDPELGNAVVEDSVDGQRPPPRLANPQGASSSKKDGTPAGAKEWDEQLLAWGYGQLRCQIPNKAVQAVLCSFEENSVHEFIMNKELTLYDSKLSAVAYLGFNGWLAVLARYNKSPQDVFTDLARQYSNMFEYVCSRTEKEDFTCAMGDYIIPYMEETNKVSTKNKRQNRYNIPSAPPRKQSVGNSIFGAARAGAARAGAAADTNANRRPEASDAQFKKTDGERLNMFNSYFFPALPNEVVESLGKQFDHTLWKCKNFGVLAPISAQSFASLADLKEDQIRSIIQVVENGEYILEKTDIDPPFTTQVFDKTCRCPYGIYANQKSHMAYTKIKRDDQFAMKIWRCFCPYIKCGCDKIYLKDGEKPKCRDNITWFDQAIWYLLNHLDVLYPNKPLNEALLSLIHMISTSLQHVALEFVGFTHFRDTLVKVAYDYAIDRDSKVVLQKYGNKEMVKIALNMIMAPKKNDDSDNTSGSLTVLSRGYSYDADPDAAADFYPPRLVRNTPSAGNGSEDMSTASAMQTCNLGESSVSKPRSPRRLEHEMEPNNLNLD